MAWADESREIAARPRFLVVLTDVRPWTEHEPRDERHRPERIVEAIGATDRDGAAAVFRAMCALPSVRAGRRRAKVVPLAGLDWREPGPWVAPLVTDAGRRALRAIGARRRRPWR